MIVNNTASKITRDRGGGGDSGHLLPRLHLGINVIDKHYDKECK